MATIAVVALDGELPGAISLTLDLPHRRGQLGIWIGTQFWQRGIATEAAQAILHFGFAEHALYRLEAMRLIRNPASG